MIRRASTPSQSVSQEELLKASDYLRGSRQEEDADYVKRSNVYSGLSDEELVEQWCVAFEELTQDLYKQSVCSAWNNLESELRLRSIHPPEERATKLTERFIAAADEANEHLKRHDPEAYHEHADRVGEKWDDYFASKAKPKH